MVEGRQTVDVVLHDGRRVQGQVVERGAGKLDVALVQVPLKETPILPLGGASTRSSRSSPGR
nr:hypothetical protein [Pyxidicoccus trucidator]